VPEDDPIAQIRALLVEVSTLSLATVDNEGRPYAANLYFAADDDLSIYFVSDDDAHHSRHIARRDQVAATVYAPVMMWQQIRGVQLRGACRAVDESQRDAAWSVYLHKFPHIIEIEDMIRAQRFYRIQPTWLRLIDNTVKFGYKVETTWPR
jgi:hypothetical protein